MEKENYKLYDGKINLEFNSRYHTYTVNEKVVYGTTSIINVLSKPALMFWAVNQSIDFMRTNLRPGKSLDEIQIKDLLENAKRAHTIKKNRSADTGTMIHEWVEKFLKAGLTGKPLPKKPVNKEMKNAIDGFIKWIKENDVKFLASEQKIYSKKYRYAGTLDIEALVNGKRTIIDIKTSKAIYPEMLLQASAYLKAREEETGKKYDGGVIILRLSKEDKGKEIKSFEVVKDNKVDQHFKCFLACLIIYTWRMAVKREEIAKKFL